MRLLMTAGFDRAYHVIALGELLLRDGHEVSDVCVASPFTLKRFRYIIRQRGRSAISKSIYRMIGIGQETDGNAPLQNFLHKERITFRSLKKWCLSHMIPYHVVSDLNAPKTVELVRSSQIDAVVYGGGGILRYEFIEAAKRRVLNAHSGPLPQIRGMNACEWSILLDLSPQVTIHYINEGIDTGNTLAMIPISVEPGECTDHIRSKCVVAGVLGLRQVINSTYRLPIVQGSSSEFHRQCYVMAPAIREILEQKLARHAAMQART